VPQILLLYVTHLRASPNQFCLSVKLRVSMAFRTFSFACKGMGLLGISRTVWLYAL